MNFLFYSNMCITYDIFLLIVAKLFSFYDDYEKNKQSSHIYLCHFTCRTYHAHCRRGRNQHLFRLETQGTQDYHWDSHYNFTITLSTRSYSHPN